MILWVDAASMAPTRGVRIGGCEERAGGQRGSHGDKEVAVRKGVGQCVSLREGRDQKKAPSKVLSLVPSFGK